jgi:hypothetical protein
MDDKPNLSTLERIERFLQDLIIPLEPIQTDPVGRGRPRILPALCLWAGMIVCVLRGWSSQLTIWRLLAGKGLWHYPRFLLSDQAIYKRMEEDGEGPLQELFWLVSQALQDHLAPFAQPLASFASQVVAIDQVSLDQVARSLPLLREVASGDHRLLPGKLASVFDVRSQQWTYVEYLPDPDQNEKVAAPDLLAHIQRGALILMDLGFFSFAWLDQLTQEGYFWITRMRAKTSYAVLHTFYQQGDTFDGLIWLGAYRADRARYAVRLIQFRVGDHLYQYLTNVSQPHLLSLHEVAVLYARRWDIELAFKLIKRELGLHLLWSAKLVVIVQQVWAVLLISQILHALQLEIAAQAGVDPFEVSVSLLVQYLPAWHDVDLVALIVAQGRRLGFIRPSRRIRIQTPQVDLSSYLPPPPDLVRVREPRYAHKT